MQAKGDYSIHIKVFNNKDSQPRFFDVDMEKASSDAVESPVYVKVPTEKPLMVPATDVIVNDESGSLHPYSRSRAESVCSRASEITNISETGSNPFPEDILPASIQRISFAVPTLTVTAKSDLEEKIPSLSEEAMLASYSPVTEGRTAHKTDESLAEAESSTVSSPTGADSDSLKSRITDSNLPTKETGQILAASQNEFIPVTDTASGPAYKASSLAGPGEYIQTSPAKMVDETSPDQTEAAQNPTSAEVCEESSLAAPSELTQQSPAPVASQLAEEANRFPKMDDAHRGEPNVLEAARYVDSVVEVSPALEFDSGAGSMLPASSEICSNDIPVEEIPDENKTKLSVVIEKDAQAFQMASTTNALSQFQASGDFDLKDGSNVTEKSMDSNKDKEISPENQPNSPGEVEREEECKTDGEIEALEDSISVKVVEAVEEAPPAKDTKVVDLLEEVPSCQETEVIQPVEDILSVQESKVVEPTVSTSPVQDAEVPAVASVGHPPSNQTTELVESVKHDTLVEGTELVESAKETSSAQAVEKAESVDDNSSDHSSEVSGPMEDDASQEVEKVESIKDTSSDQKFKMVESVEDNAPAQKDDVVETVKDDAPAQKDDVVESFDESSSAREAEVDESIEGTSSAQGAESAKDSEVVESIKDSSSAQDAKAVGSIEVTSSAQDARFNGSVEDTSSDLEAVVAESTSVNLKGDSALSVESLHAEGKNTMIDEIRISKPLPHAEFFDGFMKANAFADVMELREPLIKQRIICK